MNTYIAPWHIFIQFEGAPVLIRDFNTPEIYYS